MTAKTRNRTEAKVSLLLDDFFTNPHSLKFRTGLYFRQLANLQKPEKSFTKF